MKYLFSVTQALYIQFKIRTSKSPQGKKKSVNERPENTGILNDLGTTYG